MMRPLHTLCLAAILVAAWGGWRFQIAAGTHAEWLAAIAARQPVADEDRRAMPASASVLPEFFVQQDPAADGNTATPATGAIARLPNADLTQAHDREPVQGLPVPPRGTALLPEGPAHTEATAAYALLARGNRRAGAAGLAAAVARDPAHVNAPQWSADLAALRRRWSLDAYVFARESGAPRFGDSIPLYGGGQSAVAVRYRPDPLAARPVELIARVSVAQGGPGYDARTAQAALGIGWRPFGHGGPSASLERLVAAGSDARNAWALRLAGGTTRHLDAFIPVDVSAYAEVGLVGASRRDPFAGGQAYAMTPLASGRRNIAAGVGAWGGWQAAGSSTGRLDVGPALKTTHRLGAASVELRGEYRVRVAGDAAPGSGPAATLVVSY